MGKIKCNMKKSKNILPVAFAIFCTVVIAGSLWCKFTMTGKKWNKQWHEQMQQKPETAKASLF